MKIFTPKNGFIRMTRQYVGGIIAGFGLCAITMKFLVRSQGAQVVETPLLLIIAFLLIAAGGSLALSEQRRFDSERKP
jgi:hypothetical protein